VAIERLKGILTKLAGVVSQKEDGSHSEKSVFSKAIKQIKNNIRMLKTPQQKKEFLKQLFAEANSTGNGISIAEEAEFLPAPKDAYFDPKEDWGNTTTKGKDATLQCKQVPRKAMPARKK
jgi:hypothetical protein